MKKYGSYSVKPPKGIRSVRGLFCVLYIYMYVYFLLLFEGGGVVRSNNNEEQVCGCGKEKKKKNTKIINCSASIESGWDGQLGRFALAVGRWAWTCMYVCGGVGGGRGGGCVLGSKGL